MFKPVSDKFYFCYLMWSEEEEAEDLPESMVSCGCYMYIYICMNSRIWNMTLGALDPFAGFGGPQLIFTYMEFLFKGSRPSIC